MRERKEGGERKKERRERGRDRVREKREGYIYIERDTEDEREGKGE